MMDKYIVEIDGKNICTDSDGSSKLALSVKADNGYAVFCTEIPLTPYTEPDTSEAYQRGYETAKHECEANIQSNRDEAYNKGHNDGFKFGYEKLKDLEHERVEKAYQRGYKEAYDTAYADAEEIYESGKRAMYQKGLKDAWEAARKITGSVTDGSLNYNELNVLFGSKYPESIINKYSASEAIEKIRQYEQEKDRLARIEYNFDEIKDVLETTVKECNVSLDEIAEVLQKMKEKE